MKGTYSLLTKRVDMRRQNAYARNGFASNYRSEVVFS
jgi:hypothetical protein